MSAQREKKLGRPTTTSREEILEAAISLLEEGGENGLSFRKLGAKLGLSAPSIYTYFPNKQALLQSLSDMVFHVEPYDLENTGSAKTYLASLLTGLRKRLLEKQHLLFLFNTALPKEAMLDVVIKIAVVIESEGVEHGKSLRMGQSLLWMVIGFTMIEAGSTHEDVLGEFQTIEEPYNDVLSHLDVFSHDRLWEETLERNLLFLDKR